jgi:HEPN domain-containing protein
MAKIDVYAQDAREWRMAAEGTLQAATLLFNLNNPAVWFSASILGHHALEMLLKSALIQEGYTVVPGKPEDGFVWGHDLEELAKLLASKRSDFSLQISPRLARFDTFFNELRYPKALHNVDSLGPGEQEGMLLVGLMTLIRPFASRLPVEELQS